MKKIILTIILTLMLLGINNTISVYAQDTTTVNEEDIKIDETNFPNRFLREKIQETIDKNHDNVLQEKEINEVTVFSLSLESYYEENPDTKENYYILDCKGLEYFKNLKILYLDVCRHEYDSDQRGYVNFNSIYQLKNLEKLTLVGDNLVEKWYFNKLPSLKELKLEGIVKVKKMKFGKNLEKITLYSVTSEKKLDLSSVKKLKKFSARGINFPKVKFGKNKHLKAIDIWAAQGGKIKTIKAIDVSGLKNLKYLRISDCTKLKSVKFGKNKKLVEVSIDAKRLKSINLKGCRVSKQISLTKGTKIKNLWKGYKGVINYY